MTSDTAPSSLDIFCLIEETVWECFRPDVFAGIIQTALYIPLHINYSITCHKHWTWANETLLWSCSWSSFIYKRTYGRLLFIFYFRSKPLITFSGWVTPRPYRTPPQLLTRPTPMQLLLWSTVLRRLVVWSVTPLLQRPQYPLVNRRVRRPSASSHFSWPRPWLRVRQRPQYCRWKGKHFPICETTASPKLTRH